MGEKEWNLSLEQLRALWDIRANCRMLDDCGHCPLASNKERELCVLGDMLPESWALRGLEYRNDG